MRKLAPFQSTERHPLPQPTPGQHIEDQVRGSLQCEMSSVLSAGLGQPRKSPAGLLCQLWPAADIGVLARRTTSIFKIARGLGVRTPIFRPRPIPLAAPEFGEQVDSNSVSKFSECSHRCRWHCQRARVEHARAQPSIRSYQGGGGDMLAPAPYLRARGIAFRRAPVRKSSPG